MMDQELLRDLTESYLKSLIAESSGTLGADFDSSAPFAELGLNSFHVLKIIKKLESDFGTLPKSLLFENFNINDLTNYFVRKHEPILRTKFASRLQSAPEPVAEAPAPQPVVVPQAAAPVRILEKDAWNHPELGPLVRALYERYKYEGSVSRGTRKIAPSLFIGSARRGYFNYGRSRNIILIYSYAGPPEYLAELREEMYRYCEANGLQLNILSDEPIPPIAGQPFSATPYGAMQRIIDLKDFSLDGGAMRRLRYQVSKFEKAGACRTVEYRCGTDPETDKDIVRVIDRWCEAKTMINPLVHEVRAEILAGMLSPEHRLFLTYLDDVLQNVILITAMSEEENGYLMDLEFYPPDMPLGGLEYAIVQIMGILAAEGSHALSLGGTYGCKVASSEHADPELDRILDELREQKIFNDEGNLQFKNKFRPVTKPIYLCRPVGSGNADNVIDIIMMIADPDRMRTPDVDAPPAPEPPRPAANVVEMPLARHGATAPPSGHEPSVIEGNFRSRILAEHAFNPLQIPHEHVDVDLKTDSWAQLAMPAIDAQMRHLHGQLQNPISVDDALRSVFPFAHFVLTASGQAAEHVFFKGWPRQGIVLQNLLFPSTIFHQIDKGFTPVELPHPSVFRLQAQELYKGNIDVDALQSHLERDAAAVAMVVIEVNDNAAGGHPVSLRNLRDVKALLARHSIPLVIDATRVVENAQFLAENDSGCGDKGLWGVLRDILSCADAVIGSLTKDFCVNRGGIIATNDRALYQKLQQLVQEEGAGIDLIDRKRIALSLQSRKQIESKVLRRMEHVRLVWRALRDRGVPVVQPAGGHCVLIDVKQIPEFAALPEPVASFVAWLYLNTGIRAAGHNAGMQTQTALNHLVRLAIPVGLKREQVDDVIERVAAAFIRKVNIPELVLAGTAPQPLGGVFGRYALKRYHNVAATVVPRADVVQTVATPPPPPPPASPSPQTREAAVVPRPDRTRDVAIVGMAGRYPKAKTSAELWANLASGRDCIEDLPADRYERRLQHGSAERYRGGFIDDVDRFDSLFFNISPREAEMLDPQERLFLEVAWEAIEDAGYYPEVLGQDDGSRNIGVFVGAVWAMYQMLGVEEKHAGNRVAPNSFLWSIANRVSYCFNFSGPSLTIDTACSSSLTAMYLACEAIQAGECSAAIVGGVNLDLHQAKLEINQNGGALSPDGVCRAFGKGANGYVAGEGIGALLLKPLDQAVRDGDHIYAVIKGTAVNHGGRTSGYIVPNPKAQASVIVNALQRASVDPRTIGYIEAHGTGTELGDPTEVTGLNNAFQPHVVENRSCALGSVKTNIGHLEAAAGVAGVAKVLLQMKHRKLVPSLHSSEPNEFIDFESSPFYVVQKLEDWQPREIDGVRHPLRAGVSSFGAGGANAHVVLESYDPPARPQESTGELIFPLSAKSEEQLREVALRLADAIRGNGDDLADVAYTLQVGRKSFDHRLAVVATTKDDLLDKLAAFLAGRKGDDIASGHVKSAEGITRLLSRREKEEFVRLLAQGRDPRKIAGLWAEGLLADWHGFQPQGARRRVPLPTYPFADRRHWVGDPTSVRRAVQPQLTAGVHPLVDSNESTFERQLFKKTFHDRDFFIYDHHVADIPTLPGVAYLELARKAGELAAGRPVRRIRNILWVSPIAVQGSVPKEVYIELKPSGDAVQFEVFSETDGQKTLHSQGKLLYATREEAAAAPEYIDLDAIRARCARGIEGRSAYPLFKSLGLGLGPSFQVLQEVHRSDQEALGVLKLPEFRHNDLQNMILHPSLVDGSLQAGMAARLTDNVGEMMVPFSIGEVEILHPLQPRCYSYTTEAKDDKKDSRVLKSNVLITDESGKVLVRIRESTGVPLRDIHRKPEAEADAEGFARLYYGYEWRKAPVAADHRPQSILLFATDERLREVSPVPAIMVRPGESFREIDERTYEIDPRRREDFARLFEVLVARNVAIENICFAWPLAHAGFRGDDPLRTALERGIYSLLFLCQSLIAQKLEGNVQLLYVYSTKAGDPQPQHEAVNGFVNTMRLEHPKLLCKTVEVRQESVVYEEILDAVSRELAGRAQDSATVRYEGGERYVRTLEAAALEPAAEAPLKQHGVYLITGGAGGLGLIFAEYLAKEYRARLVLTGRSPLSAERQSKLDELRQAGAEVVYVPADVSSADDVRRVVDETKARFGALNGIVHSAGVLRDAYLRNKTAEELQAVFAPKVFGTLHLDEATKDEALDFFVTFSSLAAVTGNAGQCDYSYANHFMDSFADARERLREAGVRSGRTVSINWALWADGGMKPDEQTEAYFRKSLGMRPLSIATGLDTFRRGLSSAHARFAVLEGIQDKLEQAWGLRKKSPAAAPAAPAARPATAAAAETAEGDLLTRLQDDLTQIVMDFLKLERADVAADKVLLDLGFDSIGLTSFANAINDKYQLDITPILFFDYPSIGEIAKHLVAERRSELLRVHTAAPAPAAAAPHAQQVLADGGETPILPIKKGWEPAAPERETVPAAGGGGLSPERRFVEKPIAIVGMSGVMPQSDDLDEFWENLAASKDLITDIPRDRWRWEDFYGDPFKEVNKSNSKWGGFMREVDKFDPLFFGISPREAQMMDPQQRIFLEHVWKAIEDSGQKVSDLAGTKTGVFVGVGTTDYSNLLTDQHVGLDGYTASGNSHSVTANRVSFLLNLRGPSAPIDTACSSSLVALHRAIESIHTGSCDMAIVGGVQVMLSPAAYISFGSAGMLSSDGRCKTFDKRANGYVRGEGCGAIFLKPLDMAEADGNHIYAVIRATAENHGGRVTTMTAPNSTAQTELLIEAYEHAQVDPSTVGYIECHGTGTSLGDPIEIQALTKAFAELYQRRGKRPPETPHCGLSSVKTNIGHLETGAGIAGVLKVLLAMQHKQIPENLHLEEVNPYIKLDGTPFYIADRLTPWKAPLNDDGTPAPRRAGVSSFGFGGANAHVVLEEYIPRQRRATVAPGPQVIVLSAKNADRLDAYVRSLHAYLDKREVELIDLAYTLQVGRDEMPERLAVVASSTEELKRKLGTIAAGGALPADAYRNQARTTRQDDAVESLVERNDLSRLAESWVAGSRVDWHLLHHAGVPRRIPAPTYPFARERYWFTDAVKPVIDVRAEGAVAQLHPLVHRNVSTLKEQKFASRFTGKEFFLADHTMRADGVLPAVAYVEMLAAAGEIGGERKVRALRDVFWLAPVTVGGEAREVEVSLTPGRGDIDFTVKSAADGRSVVHCRGKLAYAATAQPDVLDVAEIQNRCADEVIHGKDLYPFLCTSELNLGRSFHVAQVVHAGKSECISVLQLPQHLKNDAERFLLHPSLLDGAVHTAIGVVKKRNAAIPWSVPYSVAEVQIHGSLGDVHYAHATWDPDSIRDHDSVVRLQLHLLDRDGRVLVRMKDFVAKPVRRPAAEAVTANAGRLQSFVPVWKPVPLDAPVTLAESTRIVLVGGDGPRLEWVRQAFPSARVVELPHAAGIDAVEKALADCAFDQLLWIAPDAIAAETPVERMIEGQEDGVLAVFRIIKALLRQGYAHRKLQWTLVTRGTQHVTADDAVTPAHAGVAGLIGTLAKEYPNWDLRLLDVESLQSVSARECLSLPWDKQGNALAHRNGAWHRQEMSLVESLPKAASPYRDGGVYVVIGGAGGVGEVWSRFVIERHQANVVWIGRRECDAAIQKKIDDLSRVGPAPLYIRADAADFTALQEARQKILETYPVIHGVVHSAIVLQDQSLLRMEEPAFRAGLSAKVDVSVNMDRVFGGDALDFMLFFSSIISFAKAAGQSNYSAGCTFKDSFAQSLQRRRPYPVKIMNWGYWGTVGVVADEFHKGVMAQMGIGSIEPAEGMEALQVLLGSDLRQMALVKALEKQAAASAPAPKPKPAAPQPSAQMSHDYVRQVITDKLSDALRMEASVIRHDAPFADYGVDSIVGVNVVRSISESLHIQLEPTSLFECTTVNQLADHIVKNFQPRIGAPAAAAEPQETAAAAAEAGEVTSATRFVEPADIAEAEVLDARAMAVEPIAVIGMSGRFAESENLDAFWENLAQGRDLVRPVTRWKGSDCVRAASAAQPYCSHGSFLDSADQFDPAFFGIQAEEATYMDPQQRLFLEECWRALEDAGYAGRGVHEKQCGVYVGCGTSNYSDLFDDDPPPQAWWGNSQSVVPARIAYHLNLQGPAIAVDTACSSALVAIHLACQALWARETEMALAGGVYVQATAGFHQVANRAGMLSPDGKCHSFDARANGFVPGEAVGVIVLKRLRDALRDGDHVHAVIAGSGVNQDGASNGLIAPNARAQEKLERAVYDRFGIHPETIQLVEAHATATPLGDSIEHIAITRAFREYTDEKQFCALGSVKTNIGHAGNAAGIASVLKVLLALKHRQIPPSLHFEKRNPGIDLENGPFYVNTELRDWSVDGDQKRRAAVSSFGFSGTNAHLVLEEAPPLQRTASDAPAHLVVLSARSAAQLRQQARDLLSLVRRTPALSLNDLAFTLVVGRMHLGHRLACLAASAAELARQLEQWLETGAAAQLYTGDIQEGRVREQVSLRKFGNYCIQECRSAANPEAYLENLAAVAELYVQGYSLEFQALFPAQSRRMPLPTYPFAKERYWINATRATAATAAPDTRLHPLLHANTSVLGQQSYRSTLTGTEFFVRDHQVVANGHGGQKVLPGAAYLEMARAAVEKAACISPDSAVVELEDTVWGPPVIVSGQKDLSIALFSGDGDEITYEIYSEECDQQVTHCQGRAALTHPAAPMAIDVEDLLRQMHHGSIDAGTIYADFARGGLDYGPSQRAITAIHQGDAQLVARLAVPAVVPAGETEGCLLHPSLVTGALQAGIRLAADGGRPSAPLFPQSLGHLRALSPCTAEMFAWARRDGRKVDIDLFDTSGNVRVEIRGLSFQANDASIAPAARPVWNFFRDPSAPPAPMSGAEKMELFLRQEAAAQLQKGIDEVPIDRSWLDLGLSSLGITHLIRNANALLDEDLPPSALFEYRDIRSLAAYLAATYAAKVDAVAAVRRSENQVLAAEAWPLHPAKLTPLPRTRPLAVKVKTPPQEQRAVAAEMTAEDVLANVLWQGSPDDDGYEKLTF